MWTYANLVENMHEDDYAKFIVSQKFKLDSLYVVIKSNNKWVPTKAPITKLYVEMRKREKGKFNKQLNIYSLEKGRFEIMQPEREEYEDDKEIALFLFELNSYYGEEESQNIMQSYLQATHLIYYLISRECLSDQDETELMLTLSEIVKNISETGKMKIILSLQNIVENSTDVMTKSMKRNMIEDNRKPLKELYLESIKQIQQAKVITVYNSFCKGDIKLELNMCHLYLKILKVILRRNIENKIYNVIGRLNSGESDRLSENYGNIIEKYIPTNFVKNLITDFWDDIDLNGDQPDENNPQKQNNNDSPEYLKLKQEHAETLHRFLAELFIVTQKFSSKNSLKVLDFINQFEKGTNYFLSCIKIAVVLKSKNDEEIAIEMRDSTFYLDFLSFYSVSARRAANSSDLLEDYNNRLNECYEKFNSSKNQKELLMRQNISRNLGAHTKIISFISKNKQLLFDAAYGELRDLSQLYCSMFQLLYKILIQFCKGNIENKRYLFVEYLM